MKKTNEKDSDSQSSSSSAGSGIPSDNDNDVTPVKQAFGQNYNRKEVDFFEFLIFFHNFCFCVEDFNTKTKIVKQKQNPDGRKTPIWPRKSNFLNFWIFFHNFCFCVEVCMSRFHQKCECRQTDLKFDSLKDLWKIWHSFNAHTFQVQFQKAYFQNSFNTHTHTLQTKTKNTTGGRKKLQRKLKTQQQKKEK